MTIKYLQESADLWILLCIMYDLNLILFNLLGLMHHSLLLLSLDNWYWMCCCVAHVPQKESFGDLLGGMGMAQPVQPVANGETKQDEAQDLSPG